MDLKIKQFNWLFFMFICIMNKAPHHPSAMRRCQKVLNLIKKSFKLDYEKNILGWGGEKPKKNETSPRVITTYLPDNPPTSIFFRFFASKITTVNLPAVGTYRNEKQMSPNFSCCYCVVCYEKFMKIQKIKREEKKKKKTLVQVEEYRQRHLVLK